MSTPIGIKFGLHNLNYVPDEGLVNNFLSEEKASSDVSDLSEGLDESPLPLPDRKYVNDIPVPLTEEEARAVEEEMVRMEKEIDALVERAEASLSQIDKLAGPDSGKEFYVEMDISKKHVLREAIKKSFGFKTNKITYTMYRQALAKKAEIEREQAKSYVNGDF